MRKNLLLSALNIALIKVNNNANINSIPCKMFIPDPSLVVNLILTNLILVLTSSQLSVTLQAVYAQTKYEIDMKCRNSSLGASFISYCRNIHEKNYCFPFLSSMLLPYKLPSHICQFKAAPQPALTDDEVRNILIRLLLDIPAISSSRAAVIAVVNHCANSIWDPSPNTLFSDL